MFARVINTPLYMTQQIRELLLLTRAVQNPLWSLEFVIFSLFPEGHNQVKDTHLKTKPTLSNICA